VGYVVAFGDNEVLWKLVIAAEARRGNVRVVEPGPKKLVDLSLFRSALDEDLLVIRHAEKLAKTPSVRARICSYPHRVVVVVEVPTWKATSKFVRALSEGAEQIYNCDLPKATMPELGEYIELRAGHYGVELAGLTEAFADRTGNDPYAIESEMQKLQLLGSPVDLSVVPFRPLRGVDVDAYFLGDVQRFVRSLTGVDAMAVFWAVVERAHQVLDVHERGLAALGKAPRYEAERLRKIAESASADTLRALLTALANVMLTVRDSGSKAALLRELVAV
jgi:hypothetical protein